MCKNHNKVFGKDAVVALVEARMSNDVCSARMQYVMRQAKAFHEWLVGQEWCEDATVYCHSIVTMTEKELDPDSDKCAEYVLEDNSVPVEKQMEFEYDEYQQELEFVADKGSRRAYSKEERMKELECKIESMKEELKLHDRIQDVLDGMEKKDFRMLNALLDKRRNEKKLSYSGWVIFKNILCTNMGWKPMKTKYAVVCLADQIIKAENKLVELNHEILHGEEYFSDSHKEADEWLEKQEQQVVSAGIVEMQTSYLCPMCGVESFPGYKGCNCR